MPTTSTGSASETVEVEGYEGHLERLEGGYTVAFEKYTADADLAEFFKGLPDDQCQAAHGGYVVTGKVAFKTPSGEETFETGDAYYVPRVTPQCCTPAPRSSSSAPPSSCSRPLDVVTRNVGSRRLRLVGGRTCLGLVLGLPGHAALGVIAGVRGDTWQLVGPTRSCEP